MTDGVDRRQASRRTPYGDEPIRRVKLRIGPELTVIDIGSHGVLVEGRARLAPGARVDVHVVPPQGRVLVRTTVVRAYVYQLRHDTVVYRAGLRFDHAIEVLPAG
jgi:PilZ domain